MKEAVVDKTKMATTVVRQEVAKVTAYSAETVKNIDKMADKVSESGRQQATAINNMTTNVVSSMSNSMASSVAAGKRGLSEMQEDLTAKILHGRMH
jgi:uroporphyrinogen-III synthase